MQWCEGILEIGCSEWHRDNAVKCSRLQWKPFAEALGALVGFKFFL